MLGPLDIPPFAMMHYSSIMARSKPDGGTRVIVILCTLRSIPKYGYSKLDRKFYKDIAWFCQFLEPFNGTFKIHPVNVKKHIIFVDASLKGMGR